MTCWVYILYSEGSDRYYIGQTADLQDRLERHNRGSEKSTKAHIPWRMVWYGVKGSKSEAMILEKKLKNLSRERLLRFIEKYI